MDIKSFDLLVFNRIWFVNTVIIKSTFSTTGHDGLFYCYGDSCSTLASDSWLLYLFLGYGIIVGE